MNALIVDDDEMASDLVQNLLEQLGHKVEVARNGQQALELLREGNSHLLITDWEMPEMGGVELCRAIRSEDFDGYVYIIMLTSRQGEAERMEGMYAGADDFLTKPLKPSELLVCLKTAERILSLETRDLALFAMAKLSESRDPETGAHIERVQSYSRLLAQHMSMTDKFKGVVDAEFIRLIYQTSPLHDIGKVGIPDAILLKPGKLTAGEYAVMKMHTELGARTLGSALARFPNAKFLHMARDIAASHHERYDGKGYPLGLAGEQIPLCARVVALADVYDALTSRRVYKEAMSHYQAKQVLLSERACHFDPDVVDAFLAAEEQFIGIKEALSEVKEERRAPATVPLAAPASADSSATILLVEDDVSQLDCLRDFLSSTGHTILTASHGDEALQLFTKHAPCLVISDWTMPGMDGLELCRQIRASERGKSTHFLMLTVRAEKDRMVEAFDAGVDDFVLKPFDHAELMARIRSGLRVAQLHDEIQRKNEATRQLNEQLSRLNQSLEKRATTDELTNLCNRRQAMVRLQEQNDLAERYGASLSIAMLDIDHFKSVNDRFGHDAGDRVLRQVAELLEANVRATDSVCRIGGEEFLIIFPAQTAQEAAVCVERCRNAIASCLFEFDGNTKQVTISAGIASRRPSTQCAQLLKDADTALYQAKNGGRNAISIWTPSSTATAAKTSPLPTTAVA
jgi:putative two-component system response regulator